MSKDSREVERMKIRQEYLLKALNHTEDYLVRLNNELLELIELYKTKEWKPNNNYIRWQGEILQELATIKRQKIMFREKIQDTVKSLVPLDEFR